MCIHLKSPLPLRSHWIQIILHVFSWEKKKSTPKVKGSRRQANNPADMLSSCLPINKIPGCNKWQVKTCVCLSYKNVPEICLPGISFAFLPFLSSYPSLGTLLYLIICITGGLRLGNKKKNIVTDFKVAIKFYWTNATSIIKSFFFLLQFSLLNHIKLKWAVKFFSLFFCLF